MSSNLYKSPLRVYLALGALALWGIIAGFRLPVSLFPNSSKPKIGVSLPYGSMTAQEFINTYGDDLEEYLRSVRVDGSRVENLTADYYNSRVQYTLDFAWGADSQKALRETQLTVNALASQYPLEVRQGLWVWDRNDQTTGFLAISFFSQTRSLDDLYKYLKPQIMPSIQSVKNVAESWLWNPNEREIMIDIDPERAASLQVWPRDIANALIPQLQASSGGNLTVGLDQLNIDLPAAIHTVKALGQAIIPTRSGAMVHLSDVARINFGAPEDDSRSIKTSGAPSLIFEATPRPGGNIKEMSENILSIIKAKSHDWPKDVQYKVLVDPSEFIRSAVDNVLREVFLAASLAVFVLFLFIGNLRNVVTAAIEIPISIVMAFILMKFAHINLNLISLGGLALSAGMNVDGSVVVMENIFRHFDEARKKGRSTSLFADRLQIVSEAVREVRFPIIASTIASLVVFLPLAFTSALTNAVLGDLALAVVFSHGFSAIVALVLVPTVRLQLMSKFSDEVSRSPLERALNKVESFYTRYLTAFLESAKLRMAIYGALTALLVVLTIFVLPRLPHELIGQPNTDWVEVDISTQGHSLLRQMESITDKVESQMLQTHGDLIQYTFTQTWGPNYARILARLKNKSKMMKLWKGLEHEFTNTPDEFFNIKPWNPSRLPIPDPPDFQVAVTGPDVNDRVLVGQDIWRLLSAKSGYPRIQTEPSVTHSEGIQLDTNPEQWALLEASRSPVTPSDLADMIRVATTGKRVWQIPIGDEITPINLAYPENRVRTLDDLASLPVGVGGHLVPLKALAQVKEVAVPPDHYRENGTEKILIEARRLKGDKTTAFDARAAAEKLIDQWQMSSGKKHTSIVSIEDPQKDLTEALHELGLAVGLSILLIFMTMVFQFGDVVNSLLVLVAIPLGFIGVLTSLFVFRSTLSLNSVLGVILLNGIAVANSILLVDFLKRMVDSGLKPKFAAVEAARKRLRPILMTSMTTGLGMLPIALGLGEGGRILQPLGVAVVGGLSFSMLTTLFIVPALQVSYLDWRDRRRETLGAVQFGHPDLEWSNEQRSHDKPSPDRKPEAEL